MRIIGGRFLNIFKTIAEDVRNVKAQDPAAQNSFVIWLTYPGLHARWSHVVEHWLWTHGLKSIARISSQFTRFMTGVEIHPGAQIGRRLFIDHAMGVIIGETTVIGDDCTLYQGVTLGGTGKESGKRHPTLGNNVMVGVGACVLGSITVGDNSKVGGGAVVVDAVPENCTVVGIPARIVVRDGKLVEQEQKKDAARRECLPDPVNDDVVDLQARVARLETLLAAQAMGKKVGGPTAHGGASEESAARRADGASSVEEGGPASAEALNRRGEQADAVGVEEV